MRFTGCRAKAEFCVTGATLVKRLAGGYRIGGLRLETGLAEFADDRYYPVVPEKRHVEREHAT
jgi:hypothetical protein